MPLALSGTLTDGLGGALADAKIIFQARTTSLGVLQGITAIAQSDQSGTYSLSVELGTYDIYVQPSTVPSQRQVLARNLAITDAVTADDLNGLIVDFQGQEDVTPEIIVQFQNLTAETRGYRDEAAASASAAASDEAAADQHRIDAEAARDSAQNSEQTSTDNAAATAADRGDVTTKASQVAADASSASADADRAETAADNAAAIALGDAEASLQQTFDIWAPDPERRAVEAATGGRCTIIRAPDGQASYMHVIPKFRCEDVAPGGELGAGVHPAFLVNGVEKDSFMVGMYQAFKDGNHYVSQPQRAPQNSINFDSARAGMQANGSGWHLKSNWEWAAIALWCMANGYQPTGNTNYGRSHANVWETGIREDGGMPGVSGGTACNLTGSGPMAWRHDGTPAGIADLVGSVWEWQEGMKMVDGRILLAPDNDFNLSETGYTDSGFDMPSDRTWSTVDATGASDLLKQSLVVPNGVIDPEGRLYANLGGERLPIRGGNWGNGSDAGLGALHLSGPRSRSYSGVGFRPAFITP